MPSLLSEMHTDPVNTGARRFPFVRRRDDPAFAWKTVETQLLGREASSTEYLRAAASRDPETRVTSTLFGPPGIPTKPEIASLRLNQTVETRGHETFCRTNLFALCSHLLELEAPLSNYTATAAWAAPAMDERSRRAEAQSYAINLDHTLKELQRKVREHEDELEKVVNQARTADPLAQYLPRHRYGRARESSLNLLQDRLGSSRRLWKTSQPRSPSYRSRDPYSRPCSPCARLMRQSRSPRPIWRRRAPRRSKRNACSRPTKRG